jgi:hypothetical protein
MSADQIILKLYVSGLTNFIKSSAVSTDFNYMITSLPILLSLFFPE